MVKATAVAPRNQPAEAGSHASGSGVAAPVAARSPSRESSSSSITSGSLSLELTTDEERPKHKRPKGLVTGRVLLYNGEVSSEGCPRHCYTVFNHRPPAWTAYAYDRRPGHTRRKLATLKSCEVLGCTHDLLTCGARIAVLAMLPGLKRAAKRAKKFASGVEDAALAGHG